MQRVQRPGHVLGVTAAWEMTGVAITAWAMGWTAYRESLKDEVQVDSGLTLYTLLLLLSFVSHFIY